MKAPSIQSASLGFIAILAIVLTACTTTLAPNYDTAIFDGLVSVNQELMEHFAATSGGTSSSDFDTREKAYNSLIGSLA